MTYGLAAYFLGLPDSGGAVVGALMAAFVFMDPTGQLGSRSQSRRAKANSAQLTSHTDARAASAR